MAIICIVGTVSPRLQAIESILNQAGMQLPRPASKAEPIDILQWHRHALSSIDKEDTGPIKDPGRLWELQAGEIVMANLKSPLWGWCDSASIRFLDFWLGFAPEFKFLLVCQTPQQLIAERLANADAPLNVEKLLGLWHEQHQEMLRFHHRNPDRSILVYAADSAEHPELLVAECSKRWNLSLATVGIVTPSAPDPLDALANFFSYRVSSLHPEIDALNREIMATATIFSPATFENLINEPQLEEILPSYLTLCSQKSKAAARQVVLQSENELLLQQLQQVHEELEKVFLQGQKTKEQIELLKGEKSAVGVELATLVARYDGLHQEFSDLKLAGDKQSKLAADRHAAMDKLAKEKDELTKQLAERQGQIDLLTKDRDQLKKQAAELQKQSETLDRQHKEQVSRLQAGMTEEQQEKELLLLQFHQLQEELVAVFSKEQEAKQQIELLNGACSAAREERSTLAAKFDELQQEISTLRLGQDEQQKSAIAMQQQAEALVQEHKTQISQVQADLQEERQENKLLLLQLHQVQEELEHYFLQHQQIQQQYSANQVFFRRLLEREPKFYDYDELDISPLNRGDAIPSVNCRLANLTAAGRHFPSFEFAVAIEQGIAGLIFPAATMTMLLHPPSLSAEESELFISPVGTPEKLPLRLHHLAALVTSDWSLVTALIRLLNDTFAKPQRLQWNSPLSSNLFLSGLQELERQMEPHSARLRYDAVRLKREQVNPDYEHLWFEFDNLSFQGEIWSYFEFRLSCAHVRPDYFGGFPKLEFPVEGSQAPFEGWYIEASDDFGEKLELRFSLSDKSMDLGVWAHVTEHDRRFMKELAAGLPQFLSTLRQSGVQISRPWEEWRGMAAEMQSVMTQCDTAFTAMPVAAAEEQKSGLHYDEVKLKREQVNPDYEHLWFEFGNFSFQGESWPHFEFRLSCAHVRPDFFGGFPKLEFPVEGSQAPFQGWFIEASDDFGEKLELRFSLSNQTMDRGVWERVTEHDRDFMKALVAELPQILMTLRQSGIQLQRPWEDWTKMAVEMMPIIVTPLKQKGKKKSSLKKLLRSLHIAEK